MLWLGQLVRLERLALDKVLPGNLQATDRGVKNEIEMHKNAKPNAARRNFACIHTGANARIMNNVAAKQQDECERSAPLLPP